MAKPKNGGLSMSLIAILVLLVIALGVTILKASQKGMPEYMDDTNITNGQIFAEPTTAKKEATDTEVDKALNQLKSGELELDSSFRDNPVTNL